MPAAEGTSCGPDMVRKCLLVFMTHERSLTPNFNKWSVKSWCGVFFAMQVQWLFLWLWNTSHPNTVRGRIFRMSQTFSRLCLILVSNHSTSHKHRKLFHLQFYELHVGTQSDFSAAGSIMKFLHEVRFSWCVSALIMLNRVTFTVCVFSSAAVFILWWDSYTWSSEFFCLILSSYMLTLDP